MKKGVKIMIRAIIILIAIATILSSCLPPEPLDSSIVDNLVAYFAGIEPAASTSVTNTFAVSDAPTSVDEGTSQTVKIHLAVKSNSNIISVSVVLIGIIASSYNI